MPTIVPPYCWWTKSCTTKDDEYPIIYRVLTIPGGAGFCPSTVVPPELPWQYRYHHHHHHSRNRPFGWSWSYPATRHRQRSKDLIIPSPEIHSERWDGLVGGWSAAMAFWSWIFDNSWKKGEKKHGIHIFFGGEGKSKKQHIHGDFDGFADLPLNMYCLGSW